MKKIIITEYNPQWPALFEQEKQVLLHALQNYTISIEHIGSTAISGLPAKPVIDIVIGVTALSDVDSSFIQALQELGYEYVPEYEVEIPDRRYFRKNGNGTRTHQIHVALKEGEFWNRHILFRDYLREHPEDRKKYAELKQNLAAQYTDTQAYARAKTSFIQEIEKKATLWCGTISSRK